MRLPRGEITPRLVKAGHGDRDAEAALVPLVHDGRVFLAGSVTRRLPECSAFPPQP
jgi:hypothetical protein